MLKKFIILFVIGIVVVIVGAMLKIGDKIQNTDILLGLGLLIELIAVLGIIKFYVKTKENN